MRSFFRDSVVPEVSSRSSATSSRSFSRDRSARANQDARFRGACGDQPQADTRREMLADGRLGKVHVFDKVADPVSTGSREVLEESQACGFGESVEERGMTICHLTNFELGRDRIDRHMAMISPFGVL